MCTKRFKIYGLVQGVFFRKYTQQKALELSLKGTIRNRLDGSVEARATGSEQNLQIFEEWLWSGSPQSKVSSVEVEKIDLENWEGFEIVASA